VRPIVFMTDYGLQDAFVGTCHAVIERIAPGARVIDLTHAIPPQDVTRGAIVLGRAVRFLSADAVVVAVVDPGVGTERRPVAVAAGEMLLVGPDNGVISRACDALGGASHAREITSTEVVLQPVSATFHGRDVFAPAAAHLAAGLPLEHLGPEVDVGSLRRIEVPRPAVRPGAIQAHVSVVDAFGNVQLDVEPVHLAEAGLTGWILVGGRSLPLVTTFAELHEGEIGALIDSDGFLAIVANRASAADALGLETGGAVALEAQ
jgi:hypothetical protein